MTDYPHRVQLDSVRWLDFAPGLRLFRSFRQSLAPGRMFLALLLVVLIFLGGKALDFVWGDQVYRHEVDNYASFDAARYERFLELQREAHQRAVELERDTNLKPIFQTFFDREVYHFNRMASAAVGLNFGFTEMLAGQTNGGVIGELSHMVVVLPGWMLRTHTGFSMVYLLYAFVLTMILGGAIARMAALDACRGQHISPFDALRFALHKAGWLIGAPLLPLLIVGVIALVLMVVGIGFNWPVTDIVLSLVFFLLLLIGMLAALVMIGLALGAHLLTPAVAVEDADGFDAVSRAFSYVVAHPWRYLVYGGVSLVYGALGYLFVGLIVFLTLWATKTFSSLLVFTEASENVTRLDAILPDPQLGQLMYEMHTDTLDGSGAVAATIISVWVKLLLAIMPAFCVSFYFTATTWMYLLLRYYTDGAALDDVAVEADPNLQAASVPEKVEQADGDAD